MDSIDGYLLVVAIFIIIMFPTLSSVMTGVFTPAAFIVISVVFNIYL